MKNVQQRRIQGRAVYQLAEEIDFSADRSVILCNGCVETKGAYTVGSSRETKKHYHDTEDTE